MTIDDYRPLPFWSWNDRLDPDELRTQLRELAAQGCGGAFMHARSGLETAYMSEEWMACIAACLDEGKRLGLALWCYDEYGWPSGIAGGIVTSGHLEHNVKWLEERTEPGEADVLWSYEHPEGRRWIVVCSSSDYADTLSAAAVRSFLDSTHERYFSRFGADFGGVLRGFFTDEPQYRRDGLPWSNGFAEDFRTRFGYDLLPQLPLLFHGRGDAAQVRRDYWRLVNVRLGEAFFTQINDWCAMHGVDLTGHVLLEDTLRDQMSGCAGAMPLYARMSVPGVDWLGASTAPSPVMPKQAGSVAAQLGRPRVLSESFALCGWDMSFADMKRIAEWQLVNGVNLFCPHLAAYSLRGARKRDFPPSVFVQQPWWKHFHYFSDTVARLGCLLGRGEDTAEVLVLHPLSSVHAVFTPDCPDACNLYDAAFAALSNTLSGLHIGYHYGDESILERYGRVEGSRLRVGAKMYRAVVLPALNSLPPATDTLLQAFYKAGGTVILTAALPGDTWTKVLPLCADGQSLSAALAACDRLSIQESGQECTAVHAAARVLDGRRLWYLVNMSAEPHTVTVQPPDNLPVHLYRSDLDSYIALPMENGALMLPLPPHGSAVLVQGGMPVLPPLRRRVLSLGNSWRVTACTDNALTMDTATIEWDGRREVLPLIELQERLIDHQFDGMVVMTQHFTIDGDPTGLSRLFFCMEASDRYEVTLNGMPLSDDDGWFVDKAIRRYDIRPLVVRGVNEIRIAGRFFQRPEVYAVLSNPSAPAAVMNRLTYDTELESTYLSGDFSVFHTDCGFVVRPPVREVTDGDLTLQGFPFFAGEISLTTKVIVHRQPDTRYFIAGHPRAAVAEVLVNGRRAGLLAWEPYEVEVTSLLCEGENTVTLSLCSGSRNLLGPHHYPDGECAFVGPHSFSSRQGWTNPHGGWNAEYRFVPFGWGE